MAARMANWGAGLRPRVSLVLALTAVLSGLITAPATAGPSSEPSAYFPARAADFTVDPAVGGPIGNTLILWGTGTATAVVDFTEEALMFFFDARAQPCEGSPRLQARIDGVTVFAGAISGTGNYAVSRTWPPGRHTLEMVYVNDQLSAMCDRNVKISHVGWSGYSESLGGPGVELIQYMDMAAVEFSPASAGVGATGGATLWTSGSFTAELDSYGAQGFYIIMEAPPCGGLPRFSLRIDGKLITEQTIPEPQGGSYKPLESVYFGPDRGWPDGLHTIEIGYLDDLRTENCDRNLTITSVMFGGTITASPHY